MRFMNDYDVARAARFAQTEPAREAVRQVALLQDWANQNSDGWAYWPKPARSAARLMDLIVGDGTNRAQDEIDARCTPEAVRKALRPIKAFRTRCIAAGMPPFQIVEV